MRLDVKSLRFLGGFVIGAAASTASCVAALNIYRDEINNRKEEGKLS